MALHLLKLCVGCADIADLESWIAKTLLWARRQGRTPESIHTTRMIPKRADELLAGGSLYWVIKGQIACRQSLAAIRPFSDADGVSRCHLALKPKVTPVEPRPCRPFQGWRYLSSADAPPDLDGSGGDGERMPDALRRELRALGLV